MGGGEKDKANRMQDETYARQQTQQDEFNKRQSAEYDTAQDHAKDLYTSLSSGYKELGKSPVQYNASFDPLARETASDFAKTGGVSDQQKGSINETIGSLKQFGKTGGLDDAAMQRMQGNGYYDEYAKTGGVDDAQKQNIRARAGAPIVAGMKRAVDAQNQMSSIQGGYGPGGMVMRDRMMRGANADSANAALGAEDTIMQRVNQGRQFGISGMSDSATRAQGLRTGNMARGMEGAGNLDMDLARTVQSGREWGGGQLSSLNEQENAAKRYGTELDLGQRLAGLGGLSSLYGGGPGEVNSVASRDLQGDLGYSGSEADIANAKLQANPSFGDQLMSGISSVAGGAGGLLGGISSFRPRKPMGQVSY